MKKMFIYSIVSITVIIAFIFTSCSSLIGGAISGAAGYAIGSVANIGVGAIDVPEGSTKIGDYWVTGGTDKQATIIRYIGEEKEVNIPSQFEGIFVTRISGHQTARLGGGSRYTGAFQDNKLTSVIIPNSIHTIGEMAFMGNLLSSIVIPGNVTVIGTQAFINNQLLNVIIEKGVTTIGAEAFSNNKIESVSIPDSVTTIGERAFAFNNLTHVSIPKSVTRIGQRAFANNGLISLVIPHSSILQADIAWGGNTWRAGVNENIIIPTP